MSQQIIVTSGSNQVPNKLQLHQTRDMQFMFSGFGSRSTETSYNKVIFALLFLFQNTLLKFFDGEKCDEANFSAKLEKLVGRMAELEYGKECPPKFSKSVKSLIKFLGIQLDYEQLLQKHELRVAKKEFQGGSNDQGSLGTSFNFKSDVSESYLHNISTQHASRDYSHPRAEAVHDLNRQLMRDRSKEHGRRERSNPVRLENGNILLQRSKEDQVNIGSAEILPDHSIHQSLAKQKKQSSQSPPKEAKSKSVPRNKSTSKSPVKDRNRESKSKAVNEYNDSKVGNQDDGNNSQKSVGAGLPIQGSIHTIKEYDFTDEDDTGRENNNSFDRSDSPLGPNQVRDDGNRASLPLPRKLQAIQFKQSKDNVVTGVSNSFDYANGSPDLPPYSSNKRLLHNEDTIRHSQNMRNILDGAKKDRKKDLDAQASGRLLPIKLDRKKGRAALKEQFRQPHKQPPIDTKTSPRVQNGKLLSQSFQDADNTPPPIESKRLRMQNSQNQSSRRNFPNDNNLVNNYNINININKNYQGARELVHQLATVKGSNTHIVQKMQRKAIKAEHDQQYIRRGNKDLANHQYSDGEGKEEKNDRTNSSDSRRNVHNRKSLQAAQTTQNLTIYPKNSKARATLQMFVNRKNDRHKPYEQNNTDLSMNNSSEKNDERKKYRSVSTKDQQIFMSNQRHNRDIPKDLIYNGSSMQPPVQLGYSDEQSSRMRKTTGNNFHSIEIGRNERLEHDMINQNRHNGRRHQQEYPNEAFTYKNRKAVKKRLDYGDHSDLSDKNRPNETQYQIYDIHQHQRGMRTNGNSKMDEMRNIDQSMASSGKWRKPADIGSVGVDHAAGAGFSQISRDEILSANATRPNPNILGNNLHVSGAKEVSMKKRFNRDDKQNGRNNTFSDEEDVYKQRSGPMQAEFGVNEEPSLPHFPSSLDENHSPRTLHKHRHTANQNSTQLNNEQLIVDKRYRLHTRAGPVIPNNQNDFDDTAFDHVNQYGKTMDNWNKAKYKMPESSEIDTGVDNFLSYQQAKRNKVNTGQVRSVVNQSQSMQDKREIFSEEDFQHPEFHQFRLPEFSREHHESLFESQNKKLQQQIRVFEDTNDKKSKMQSSQSKLSQPGGLYLESRESLKDQHLGDPRFIMRIGSQESNSRIHSNYQNTAGIRETNETQRSRSKIATERSKLEGTVVQNLNNKFKSNEDETDQVDFETNNDNTSNRNDMDESKENMEGNYNPEQPRLSAAVQQHILEDEIDEQSPNPFGDASSDDFAPITGYVGKMPVDAARQSLKDAVPDDQAKATELTRLNDNAVSMDQVKTAEQPHIMKTESSERVRTMVHDTPHVHHHQDDQSAKSGTDNGSELVRIESRVRIAADKMNIDYDPNVKRSVAVSNPPRRDSNYHSNQEYQQSFSRSSSNGRKRSTIQPYLQHQKEKSSTNVLKNDYGTNGQHSSQQSLNQQRRTRPIQRLPQNVTSNISSLDKKLRRSRDNLGSRESERSGENIGSVDLPTESQFMSSDAYPVDRKAIRDNEMQRHHRNEDIRQIDGRPVISDDRMVSYDQKRPKQQSKSNNKQLDDIAQFLKAGRQHTEVQKSTSTDKDDPKFLAPVANFKTQLPKAANSNRHMNDGPSVLPRHISQKRVASLITSGQQHSSDPGLAAIQGARIAQSKVLSMEIRQRKKHP